MVAYYRLRDLGFKLTSGAHVVSGSEFSAVEEANRLLCEAERTCEEMSKQAELAYQSEMRRGYEEGLAHARVESIGRLLGESRELDQGLLGVERDLARLVAECVRKLIDGFDDLTKVEAVVRVALRQMRREKRAELRVSPGLHDHFKGRISTIVKEFPEIELVDVVEDRSLEPAQIVFETSIGRVDGNIAQRLDDLETVIRSAHAKTPVDALDALNALDEATTGAAS